MSWDDGKHAKVKRVQLTFDDVIKSIQVEYDGTSVKSQPRGAVGRKSDAFTLSPDEYITEVTGYYRTVFSGDIITALTFKTNKKTYGPYGSKTSSYFSLNAPAGSQIAGFKGSSSNALNSIDAHFAPVPPPSSTGGTGSNPGGAGSKPGGAGSNSGGAGSNPGGAGSKPGGAGSNPGGTGSNPGSTDSNPGGAGSNPGGAGSNPGGAGSNPGGAGSNPGGAGSKPGGGGSNSGSTGSNPGGAGSNPGGADSNTGSSPQKLEAQGGQGGSQWDDGAYHDGVSKIHIASGGLGIEQIKFDYVKNGQAKEGLVHGVKGGRTQIATMDINHPDEYLISVEGWSDSSNIIQGIKFQTNKTTSQYYGWEFAGDGTQFSLQVKDKKIIGFHGFAGSQLNSLGAYFVPTTTSITPLIPPTSKKLQAIGGDGGDSWDDGVFDGVKKISVGQGTDGIVFVAFEYNKGSQIIIGDGHGKQSLLGTETFELDYPSEYIISVEGYYDKIFGAKAEIVTSLTFKTNKRTSPPFGLTGGEHFELKEDGYKIVGFHGKAGDLLHQIGVYVVPITTK